MDVTKAPRVKKDIVSQSEAGETLLPAARVSRAIKADAGVSIASKEAVFVVSKMTERFLRKLADAAFTTSQLGGRKTLEYRDLASTLKDDESFYFLQEIVPMPIRVEPKDAAQAAEGSETTQQEELLPV